MSKQVKYYSIANLWKTNAEYMLLLGKRSNGKSYSAKDKALTRAWDNPTRQRFAYIRRYDADIKPALVEQYFKDCRIREISNGEADSIVVYKGGIWAAKLDPDNLKYTKVKLLGYTSALNIQSRYKSGAYRDVDFLLFEEFISDESYLPDEVRKFNNLVSTYSRERAIHVVMIGNTISRVCPYYTEWNLNRVAKQKQGEIDTYEYEYSDTDTGDYHKVKIAVEFCENNGNAGKMFFGESTNMITTGAWETPNVPRISYETLPKKIHYTAVFECMGFRFLATLNTANNLTFWYIRPKTTPIKPKTRVFTDKEVFNRYYTKGMRPVTRFEREIFGMFTEDRVFYSSPLCAADFRNILRQMRRAY